jgi:hypothetical protein
MEWIRIIVAFLSGGLAGAIFQTILKRGKVIYDNSHVNFQYYVNEQTAIQYIGHFNLDIQFINTSGNQIILKDFIGRFYNGSEFRDLLVDNARIPPARIMEPKVVKLLNFIFTPVEGDNAFSMLYLLDDTAYFELSYVVKGKTKKNIIPGSQFNLLKGWLAF